MCSAITVDLLTCKSKRNMAYDHGLDDEALQSLFTWIDSIPLSRKKKNIARDFSDGCKSLFQTCVVFYQFIEPSS